MDTEKIDRRVRKTKMQLRLALTSLMLEKGVNEITVREIAEKADVNRGTFYAHYKDVYDLLSQLEENVFRRIDEIGGQLSDQPSEAEVYTYLTAILKLVSDNSDIYLALVCRNGDVEFQQRLLETLKAQYLQDFLAYYYPTDAKMTDFYCSFIVSGMLAITQDWLESGQRETPEQMAKMGGDFIMKGIDSLRRGAQTGRAF